MGPWRDACAERPRRFAISPHEPTGTAEQGRDLSEITTLHGQQGARGQGSIGQLIPRLVDFGETRVEALCKAIITDFGAPA
jgi:hypothetical protein